MSYYKAAMHQIQFRLGLCPRPRLQRFPDVLAGFKGPTFKERKGVEEKEREKRDKGGKGRG